MNKKYVVELKDEERERIQHLLHTKETSNVEIRKHKRTLETFWKNVAS